MKLADFGQSKDAGEILKTVTGTAYFMAPEVIKGQTYGQGIGDPTVGRWGEGQISPPEIKISTFFWNGTLSAFLWDSFRKPWDGGSPMHMRIPQAVPYI